MPLGTVFGPKKKVFQRRTVPGGIASSLFATRDISTLPVVQHMLDIEKGLMSLALWHFVKSTPQIPVELALHSTMSIL